jgi:hypothetical protein
MSAAVEVSLTIPSVANTQALTISASSAAMATAIEAPFAVVYPTVNCFAIAGAAPVATTSCMPLIGGTQYRVHMRGGRKLAFITASGAGIVYITPDA